MSMGRRLGVDSPRGILVADGNTVFDLQYKSFPAVTLHEVYRNAAMLAIDTLSGLAQKAG